MRLYLDTSALVKLVKTEPESGSLVDYLEGHREDVQTTSALARTELVRAIAPTGSEAVAQARRLLTRINQIGLERDLLDAAAELASTPLLRSLDAIHLACAQTVMSDLRAVISYDGRMLAAAEAFGLPTLAPS